MSNKRHTPVLKFLTILGIIFLAAMIAPLIIPTPAHGQMVGTVCVAPQGPSTSGCPSSPATITGSPTIGSHVVVAINIQDSDGLNGFRIFVKTDNTVLNPWKADTNNTVLLQPILPLANCVNGAGKGCSLIAGDGPGVVDVGVVSIGGLNIPPVTGGLFEIVYNVTSSTTGTPINFLTGTCSTGSSVPGLCVTITNGGGTAAVETAQTGTFTNLPTFSISATPTFVPVTVGTPGTSAITVNSVLGFTGTISLTRTFNSTSTNIPPVTLAPLTVTLGASGTSTLTVSPNASNQAGGYNVTVTGTGGNPLQKRSVFVIVKVSASPTLTTSLSSASMVVGSPVHDSATLAQASPIAGGSVTYSLFTTADCTGSAQAFSQVTVSAGSVPSSRDLVINNTGAFSLKASYSGDTYNNPSTSPCEPLTVIKAGPSITTMLSSTTINPGSAASDTATITNGFFGPASGPPFSPIVGNVTYNLFTTSSCTGASTVVSVVHVNGNTGLVPPSSAVTFNAAGTFSWNATYTGDSNNKAAISSCETLIVKITADFGISSASSTLSLQVGTTKTVLITLNSIQSFAGSVKITNSTTPTTGLSLTCSPNPVALQAGGMATSICTFSAASVGLYTVVITGTSTTPLLSHSITPSITVTVTKANPSISTVIYDATGNTPVSLVGGAAVITNGTAIYDKASVLNGYLITGSVTYNFYTIGDCTRSPSVIKTLFIAGGLVPSFGSPALPVFNTPGFFSMSAVYNGDGNNTATAPSACEPLTVNMLPVASFNVTSSSPYLVGQNLNFNATASFDPDALSALSDKISYAWNFGDGTSGSGILASHSYTSSGDKTITLTVSDHYSAVSTSLTIHVDTLVVQLSAVPSTNSTTAGKTVTVTVDLTNSGTLGLNLTVTLDVNGKTVDQKTLVLAASKDSGPFTLKWDTTSYSSGTYNVTIRIANAKTLGSQPASVNIPGGVQTLQVALTASSGVPSLPGGTIPWVILGVIVVIGVASYLLLRRRKTQTV